MANLNHQKTCLFAASATLWLCAWTAGAAGAAEMYRWVDENGVVNYTQQKPRDVDAEPYTTQGGAPRKARSATEAATRPNSTAAAGQEDLDPLTEAQQRVLDDLERQEQKRQDDIARVKQENCEQSRSVLARLTIKNRLRVQDDNGEQRIMPEDERQARISEAQQGIARYCDTGAA